MTAAPTVFDCFSGLGGMSLGASFAGMEVVGGVDSDPAAVETFGKAFPKATSLHRDLLGCKPSSILKGAAIAKGDIDILLGGPPCQPYSINNHQRGTHDARCGLVKSYLGFVSYLRPRWIVMENVPGFASIEEGRVLMELLKSLRHRGYKTHFSILRAVRFGVPQLRRRLIVIATREQAPLDMLIDSLDGIDEPLVTLKEAIGDLPEDASLGCRYKSSPASDFQEAMRNGSEDTIKNHVCSGLGEINLQRIRHIPPGGNWRNIPRNLLPNGMKRARLSDHTTRYGRLDYAQPSYTLLTKCDPHWGCFLHPSRDRILTVREAARIQSIPDKIEFPEKLTDCYRLIGNAVPPLLAKGILTKIKAELQ